uniref:50S ribosomal protein L32 n=1 Tax=Halosiphon tomentosus TaxID=64927 RepID=UPI002E7A6769|nr:50S ribosomal protein L32 [Halosiphon tomentosus]WAM63733.1 50S ribosomal protein L32 [Halosiphon tomentosus]
MAVPKKSRSKAKGRTRLAIWKGKSRQVANRALALAKSILNKDSKFIFDPKKKKDEEKIIKESVDTNTIVTSEEQIIKDAEGGVEE